MILAAHQPNYLPYPGFFNKAMLCDVFVLTDSMQYEKHDYQNRNRIRTKSGWEWMTIPVLTSNHPWQPIKEVRIVDAQPWEDRHLRTLEVNYSRSPYFKDHLPFFEKLYAKRWERLADLNETIILRLFKEFDVDAKVVKSSTLNIPGRRTDFLVNLCSELGAGTYLSGPGGKAYLDAGKFSTSGVDLIYQDYHPSIYRQRYEPFIPDMSAIDLLFNCGSDVSQETILGSTPSLCIPLKA